MRVAVLGVVALLLVLLVIPCHVVRADEEPAAGQPPAGKPAQKPLTPEQVADRVLEALRAEDQAALKALAETDEPDPWIVADELCYRKEYAAAKAFADLGTGKDTERLRHYVAAYSSAPPPRPMYDAYRAIVEAGEAKDYERMLGLTEAVPGSPETVVLVRIRSNHGFALSQLSRKTEAMRVLGEASRMAERIGCYRLASLLASNVASLAWKTPHYEEGLASATRHLQMERLRGRSEELALACCFLGNWYVERRRYERARDLYQEAVALFEEQDLPARLRIWLIDLGGARRALGEYDEALACFQRAAMLNRELGDLRAAGRAYIDVGTLHQRLGDHHLALAAYEEAGRIAMEDEDALGAAKVQNNLGLVHHQRGDWARAIECYQRSMAMMEDAEEQTDLHIPTGNIASVYINLLDYENGRKYLQRSLELAEAQRDDRLVISRLINLGEISLRENLQTEAMGHFEHALAKSKDMGNPRSIALCQGRIGTVHRALGNHEKALACFSQSESTYRALKLRGSATLALKRIGGTLFSLDRRAEARAHLRKALATAREIREPALQAAILHTQAAHALDDGSFQVSLAKTLEALPILMRPLRGLGEARAASARERLDGVLQIGIRSSAELQDVASLLHFLENGRAGALLESLRARRSMQSALTPRELRTEEGKAQGAERRAMDALQRSLQSGELTEIRRAREVLDEARRMLGEVVATIQRQAKAGAAIRYPEADGLAVIQTRLEEDEALVLYGLTQESCLALVIDRADAHIVPLTSPQDLEEALLALRVDDPASAARPAIATLRRHLVAPLALGEEIQRVLVSPVGRLGYVPFAVLFPDQEVAYVPSGTTHGLLLEERERRGQKILAVGDPDYRTLVNATSLAIHRSASLLHLSPLPATRKEVEAIADVRLLGQRATETGLQDAIRKRERWRTVHFACHGLVDPERPMLSSLALTADTENDGFLTCLEVFRMKISADLVVLSACETGKGKIYKTEGIVGLTRAFMFAGSPRVICSLWRVDDEATMALMVKFYELWSPKDGKKGLGAAAALKLAQEFIRGHEKWKHPHYWAAWVLWGLPD